MKSFKQYLSEEYKKDRRISRLLKNFGKNNPSMLKPGQTPGEAAMDNWNNPKFRESKIGQAIIAASGSKLRRNRNLNKQGVGDALRAQARGRDTTDPTYKRDRRMMQQYDSRVNKLLKKGGYLYASPASLFGGLNPEEQN